MDCPICGNTHIKLVYSISIEESARHFIHNKRNHKFQLLKSHLYKLWNSNECQVLQCLNCGFTFSYPYIGGDKIFYNLAYERSASGYPKWKFEFEETLKNIELIVKNENLNNFTLLEIGAGNGAFLKKVSEIIPSDQIVATEYSDYGKKEILNLGIEAYSCDFRKKAEEWNNRFYYVCLFQVLEHLDNLDAIFETLYKITKDKGQVFIAVPNHKRINFNEINGALLDMPPNHIGRYTKKSFEFIAKKFGWKIKNYKIEPANFKPFSEEFSLYRHLREAQKDNSLDSLIISNKITRKLFTKLRVKYLEIKHKTLINENYQEVGGASQWIHLEKI